MIDVFFWYIKGMFTHTWYSNFHFCFHQFLFCFFNHIFSIFQYVMYCLFIYGFYFFVFLTLVICLTCTMFFLAIVDIVALFLFFMYMFFVIVDTVAFFSRSQAPEGPECPFCLPTKVMTQLEHLWTPLVMQQCWQRRVSRRCHHQSRPTCPCSLPLATTHAIQLPSLGWRFDLHD